MTESNFVSEADFEKLLNSLPIQSHANEKLSVEDWEILFKVIYGCALRIKEAVGLTKENFDLKHRIITLPITKTGFDRCKCSVWEVNKNSNMRRKMLVSADKDCKKCLGRGKISIPQRTTILPQDANELKSYLDKKQEGSLIWPVSRQTVWIKFQSLGKLSKLDFFWQKKKRSFNGAWPYLLRSSRAKIMESMGAPHSYVKLKLRHALGSDVTLAYTMPDIHALLGWEAEHYPLVVA